MSSTRAYSVMYRPAEGGPETPWTVTTEAASYGSVRDELASWSGPRLHHGDLVRVEPHGSGRDLYVFDADRAKLIGAPGVPHAARGARWLTHWEGPVVSAASMLLACRRVRRRRCLLAAAGCVRTTLGHLGADRQHAEAVLVAVERWCRREATFNDFTAVWWGAESFFESAGRRWDGRDAESRRAVNSLAAVRSVGDAVFASGRASALSYSSIFATTDANRLSYSACTSLAVGQAYNAAAAAGDSTPDLAAIVRGFIPLSVALCAELRVRDPLPDPGPCVVVDAP